MIGIGESIFFANAQSKQRVASLENKRSDVSLENDEVKEVQNHNGEITQYNNKASLVCHTKPCEVSQNIESKRDSKKDFSLFSKAQNDKGE
ncbi:hypothetical protein [Helicobacter labetoulli]|uniref:hypothetical protein n=1 Tax=Helicobacter labetoulli TaxID=2315333 RepID=UPI000EF6E9DC|nr:hypothetical protein [Helicobacter labetoulli]